MEGFELDQTIVLTEKLTDLKYELPIVCLEGEIEFLSYAFFWYKNENI
jgi:hypothetical protein